VAKNPYTPKGGRGLDQTSRVYRGGGVARINESRVGYVPIKTGRRAGGQVKDQAFPDPPDTWKGTLPEWAIFWAFNAIGMKEHQAFEYQYFTEVTPNGVDFYVYDQNLIIEIFGIYWHYQLGGFKIQTDLERQIRLEAMGFEYTVIDEDDALRAPIWILREALAGRDHSRLARGAV
jgi:very-short-patch-repair endonuclease